MPEEGKLKAKFCCPASEASPHTPQQKGQLQTVLEIITMESRSYPNQDEGSERYPLFRLPHSVNGEGRISVEDVQDSNR